MDPLSISASVVGLTATCVQTAKALHEIKSRFQNAGLTIAAICTETTIISASLSRIQSSMLSDPDDLSNKLTARPDLESTLDHALTGCYIVFDVLQAEIQKFTEVDNAESSNPGFRTKLRYVWNESNMQEILSQIRGLQTALTLLLQLLSTDTMAELKQMMDNNNTVLQQVVEKTMRFRSSKASRAPQSIFEMSFATQSIHTGDGSSILSSTLFSFDDQVINSQAYRRTLAKAYAIDREGNSSQTTINAPGTSTADSENSTPANPTLVDQILADSTSASLALIDNHEQASQIETSVEAVDKTPMKVIDDDEFVKFMYTKQIRSEDWLSRWNLTQDDLEGVSNKEIRRQHAIHALFETSTIYLRSLQVLRYLYRYRLLLDFSVSILTSGSDNIIGENKSGFPGHEAFYNTNKTFLHDPLVNLQSLEGPWINSVADVFRNWLVHSRDVYMSYAPLHPRIEAAIRREANNNARFARFLDQGQEDSRSSSLGWRHCLMSPITQLQLYRTLLEMIVQDSDKDDPKHKYEEMEQLIADLDVLASDCSAAMEEGQRMTEIINLRSELGPLATKLLPKDAIIARQAGMFYKESRSRK